MIKELRQNFLSDQYNIVMATEQLTEKRRAVPLIMLCKKHFSKSNKMSH